MTNAIPFLNSNRINSLVQWIVAQGFKPQNRESLIV
jgi:hypothetical protein